MNGYELSKKWFDFCFLNPEKVKPIHTALYFFAVEHCNRLGWKEKFGLPTEMAKEAIGVKSWHTYIAAFNEIAEWGFFRIVERSKNQYSSNIIALINFDEALDEARIKATTKHSIKSGECFDKKYQSTYQSTYQSIDSIDKLINYITINYKTIEPKFDELEKMVIEFVKKQSKPKSEDKYPFEDFWKAYDKKQDREKCFKKWASLTEDEQAKAMNVVDAYVKSKPDLAFRKNPLTWLNGKCWNDDIIPYNSNQQSITPQQPKTKIITKTTYDGFKFD